MAAKKPRKKRAKRPSKNLNVEFMGAEEMTGILARHGVGAVKALGAALYATAQVAMVEAKHQVPFDTGVLKSSGRIFEPTIRGTSVVVDMGFGGAASAYALRWHQRKAHFQHGKKNRYLSDPVADAKGYLALTLARKLRDL